MARASNKLSPNGLSNEAKVGALVVLTIVLAVAFAWLIGIQNPFTRTVDFYVTYNFAGGIEVGSPVRVSGIKAGKVEKIEFFKPVKGTKVALKEPGSADADSRAVAPLKIKISIQKDAAEGVRKDSRFYVNMAGIIGERYIEVTPGSADAPKIQPGTVLAGVDPPRIDQLISQSFGLAQSIRDLVEENKGDITRSIELLYKTSQNINNTLKWVDKSAVFKTDLSKLVENLIAITSDVRKITDKVHTPEGEKTLNLLHELLWRLEPLKPKQIRKFLQDEGIKVRMF